MLLRIKSSLSVRVEAGLLGVDVREQSLQCSIAHCKPDDRSAHPPSHLPLQVAAMEQQALAQRQQAPPSEQPSQQQQGKRHVPVFRNRAFQQQALPGGAWPVESIEDADSDEEPRPAAAAGPSQAAPAAQRSAAGAVPQLGRRGALPLASQAAAAGEALASDDEEGPQAAAAAPAQQRRPGQRAAPAARAAGTGGQAAVLVDFSAIDVEALRPSVLLRWAVCWDGHWLQAAGLICLLLKRTIWLMFAACLMNDE